MSKEDSSMARHHRSLAFAFTLTTATWLIGTIGCHAGVTQAGGAPVPALISDAPVDSVNRTPSGPTRGRVVAAPGRITDFAPAESSVTVDAGTVNLRRVFEDLGDDATLWYQHVQTLANPFFEGRAPDTHGQALTADYVEFYFRKYDLEPAFSSSYTQPFSYNRRGSTKVKIQIAELSVNGRRLTEGSDFVVLGNSGDAEMTAPITFVGYGIEEGPDGYSSFDDDTDLTGRAALMLRYTPVDESGESLWDEQQTGRQGSLRRKMRAVAERGAAAIIMVNPPGADSPSTLEKPDGRFGSGLEIPVVQVSPQIADAILVDADPEGRDLVAWRRMADTDRIRTNDFDDLAVTFNTAVKRTRDRSELDGTNVAGILRGRGNLADQYVVIGGHHDHVGLGDHGGIRPTNRGQLHPGADDNASGTAGVLVLARMLDEGYRNAPRNMDLRSIIFVTFDSEEMGLHGSRAFADDLPVGAEKVSIMLNMDMIGRLRSHTLSVLGTGTGEGLVDLLRPHFERSGMTVKVREAGSGRSDDANFHAINIPAMHFFTGMHDEYTTPGDQAYTVNPAGAAEVLDLIFDIAYDVASRPRTLSYREPGPSAGENRGYGRVRLGIRPGMGDDVATGVAIDAVSAGTSADAGGMLAGDVIVGWDNKKVADMQDLFERLQTHEPGDKVKITVIRGGEKIVLDITLKAS
jgi:hypothetical protein